MLTFRESVSKIPTVFKDVFLLEEYYKLSEINGEGSFHFFTFSDNGRHAVYPFLKNEILGFKSLFNERYYDIQSAYGYGGVITNSYEDDFIKLFFENFEFYCSQNNIVAEFIRFNPLLGNSNFSSSKMHQYEDRNTIVIDLSLGYDEIFNSSYTSKTRNVIRKARKNGHIFDICSHPDHGQIKKFYEIYSGTMRRVEAEDFYLFSLNYFIEFFRLLKDSVFLAFVYNHEGEIICSSIFLRYSNFFHYHLSGRVQNSDNSVNNFMIDEAVKFGVSLGAKEFHLGGGLTNDKSDRLFKFKASFSKEMRVFKFGTRVYDKHLYEQLISEWTEKNPEKVRKYRNYLLKYRY
jgi:hypothetical protein